MSYSQVVQPSVASTGQVVGPTGPPSAWDGFVTTIIGAGSTILNRRIDEEFPEASQPDVDLNRDTALNAIEITSAVKPLYLVGGALFLIVAAVVAYKVID